MKSTFRTLFYVRKNEINKSGKASIMVRITINGEKVQFSTKLQTDLNAWDTAAGKVKGKTSDAIRINRLLDSMRTNIDNLYYKQIDEYGYASPEKIKNRILGIEKEYKTILEYIAAHNEMYAQKVGYTTSQITYRRYRQLETRIPVFLKEIYKVSDMSIRDVNPIFLEKLYLYLRKDCGVQNNYAMKFMQRFQRVFNFARNSGIQLSNPFECFQMRFEKEKRTAITQEEVDLIWQKEFASPRLEQVRDVFIFSCYCGLSFADVAALTSVNLQTGVDGNLWIMTARQKTGVDSNIRLLEIPKEILNKYQGKQKNGKLLPVVTNQKMNEYLKEVATVCRISKNITFHMARHSNFCYPLNISKLQSNFCRQVTIW